MAWEVLSEDLKGQHSWSGWLVGLVCLVGQKARRTSLYGFRRVLLKTLHEGIMGVVGGVRKHYVHGGIGGIFRKAKQVSSCAGRLVGLVRLLGRKT